MEENSLEKKEKIYYGSIVIFHKMIDGERRFLVAENAKTGNVSFVSGAQEDSDASLEETAKREIQEELGNIDLVKVSLIATSVEQHFVFGPNKKERAGHKGVYKVFLADLSEFYEEVGHTEELKGVVWMSDNDVLEKITFSDVKEVFIQAVKLL